MSKESGLGTFGGVYTPSILTILGAIMYLRFGWVVGNVGLVGTLIIVTLCTCITFLTSLSICAIATDKVVGVGGAYYMIGRSLGIESGGAVGIPLYLAQALSVALYTIGFADSVVQTFPSLQPYKLYLALLVTIGVAVLALTSASMAIRAQYFIMGAIALSLLSLVFGPSLIDSSVEVVTVNPAKESFWVVLAVFFPAVTGIMSGVNLSGDLREPTRSIPTGTLAAVGTGYLIYMVLPFILEQRVPTEALIVEPLIMERIALWGPAILLGVWGATLSSALGSILGAPRVLQALARDGVLPRQLSFLGAGTGESDEPRIGTIFTLGVAIATVCIGELNLIAPVLTMFFLTTYLVLNVCAAIEGFLQSPSFRPSFPVHWSLSFLGAVGCLGVMFLINAVATIVAALIVLGIFFWLQRRELRATWGDVRRGIWMALISRGIYHLLDRPEDSKNWRPHILVLSGAPRKRWSLIELAHGLSHGGLMTVTSVLPSGSGDAPRRLSLEGTIRDYLQKHNVRALVRLVTAPDPFEGALRLVETYGLGPLVPNTVLLGDSEAEEKRDRYCQTITTLHEAQRNVVILRDNGGFHRRKKIDVWWGGRQANGSLMLLLAYLLRNHIDWRNATIYLKLVVADKAAAEAARANLNRLMEELRIGAVAKVLVASDRPFKEILHSSSKKADLVFLGMAKPGNEGNFREYYESLQELANGLPTTVFVLAVPDFAFE